LVFGMRSFVGQAEPFLPLMRAFLLSILLHFILLTGDGLFVPVRLAADAPLQVVVRHGHLREKRLTEPVMPQDALQSLSRESQRLVSSEPKVVEARLLSSPHTRAQLAETRSLDGGVEALVQEAISPDVLRQYRMALAIQMHKYKNYPMQARAQGREGRVEVALQIMSNGLLSVALFKSSGDVVLDAQAVEMVEQGAGHLLLPDGLRGKSLRLILPLQFNLTED
jgi:TonB family protein